MDRLTDDLASLRKVKLEKEINIRRVLNKKKLDEFELDLLMNDLI